MFFSASNYLAQVAVAPAAVAQFYTNNMAVYREPDRVEVNYLAYDLTNYLAAAEQKLGKTNLASQIETYYAQHGPESVPDAKTPEEAKAKIRDAILRQGALATATEQAKQFVTELFAMDPVLPENLVTLARQKGLAVHTTAPFAATEGPEEFPAPAELAKIAFKLNADSPFSKPITVRTPFMSSGWRSSCPARFRRWTRFTPAWRRIIRSMKPRCSPSAPAPIFTPPPPGRWRRAKPSRRPPLPPARRRWSCRRFR